MAQSALSVVGKHTIQFSEPPVRIPVRHSVDAPLLGNGTTGVAIAGAPEKQTFYVARNDFWRLKSALDESYPAVLGKIELSVPRLKGGSYSVCQRLADARTIGRFEKGACILEYTAFVAATEDVMTIELKNDGKEEIKGSVLLELPGAKEIYENLPLERTFPCVAELGKQDGIYTLTRGFLEEVDIPTRAAIGLKINGADNLAFVLQPGEKKEVIVGFASDFTDSDCVDAVVRRVKTFASSRQLAKLNREHTAWWLAYWEKSYVSIPYPDIEKQYYVSLYGMGSCSRQKDFPPSIFGTWITCERPNWNGDYHLNYNHMAPYYGLYSANRIEQAEPYTNSMLPQIERGKYYSEKVAGVKDGILLPVGAGPLGIETTRRSPFMEQYYGGWIEGKEVEDDGFFMGQKSNSSYAVVNMSMHFYRTWDKEYARRVYPFVKGVSTFWQGYLAWEGNRYVIYNDAIHEGTIGTMNPVLSLGLIRMVMQTAWDMSLYLGVDETERSKWEHIRTHLSAYPVQERSGKSVFRYTERGTDWWNDNTLGIQAVYPAGQIGQYSDKELLRLAYNTVDVMQRWLDYNGSNSFFPAAVRVGYAADSILKHMGRYVRHTYPNGFQRGNPHGIENLSTVPNTINEMLCMGHQDVVRLFPVWPRHRDASFRTIRVEGAFLVSADLVGGEIRHVELQSEQGRMLVFQNPWPGCPVVFKTGGKKAVVLEGELIRFQTVKGRSYRIGKG